MVQFHANLLFWKCAIDNELLLEGEAHSAPCQTAKKRPAKRHYLSDASFEAVGGFCFDQEVFWRYDLPRELTTELKKIRRHWGDMFTVTINLLELLGMVVTA